VKWHTEFGHLTRGLAGFSKNLMTANKANVTIYARNSNSPKTTNSVNADFADYSVQKFSEIQLITLPNVKFRHALLNLDF
jgi:hypothetical protein